MINSDIPHRFTKVTLDGIYSYWHCLRYHLKWDCLFVLPPWLQAWWKGFGEGYDLYLHSVKKGDDLPGIGPLLVKGENASFIGSADVCDYQDFIVNPGMEQVFFNALLDKLSEHGIAHLDLRSLRPDSSVLGHLTNVARGRGYDVSCEPDGISLEVGLPPTWDEYLKMLSGKQRHEVKRKLRRLKEAGEIRLSVIEDIGEVKDAMVIFLDLFRKSGEDKSAFMTRGMESFFNSIASAMAELRILKLYILELEAQPAAAVMCFDYNDTIYLYNSGYDPRFRSLSVGLLCKILSLKDSIERGKMNYDFLKGAEAYKYHLGGREVHLSRCRIRIQ